jgi:hypothetical protein
MIKQQRRPPLSRSLSGGAPPAGWGRVGCRQPGLALVLAIGTTFLLLPSQSATAWQPEVRPPDVGVKPPPEPGADKARAAFSRIPLKPDEVRQGFLAHRRFANKTWVIDLLFERNEGRVFLSSRSTIRNVDPSKRVLALVNSDSGRGIELLLTQTDPKTKKLLADCKIEIKGEPLGWEQTAEFKFRGPVPVDVLNPTEEFELTQINIVAPIPNADNKRRQPELLLPDESKVAVILAQFKVHSIRTVEDEVFVKVLNPAKNLLKWVPVDKLADFPNLKPAENILPARAAYIVASFPYRRQLDGIKEHLRLPTYNAVLSELSAKLDPTTKQPLPNFRFLGVRLQRRTVVALGKPLSPRNDGWETIDLEKTFTPLVFQSGKRTQKEDDPLLEKLSVSGLVMPRLLLAREQQFPPLEKNLANIRATLDRLVKGGEEEDVLAALPVPTGSADVAIFTPMPASPAKDPKGKPRTTDCNPPESLLVRLFDVTVKPGAIYQYRFQVRLANPNYRRKDVASPLYAKEEELASDQWFDIKDRDGKRQNVVVPPDLLYYVVDQKELDNMEVPRSYKGINARQDVARDRQVSFQIHRWLENAAEPWMGKVFIPVGEWVVAERVIVGRGEPIGRVLRVDVPIWKDAMERYIIGSYEVTGQKVSGAEVNFAEELQESLLVDFEGPQLVAQHGPKKITESVSTEVLILSHDGKLQARNSESDRVDRERSDRLMNWRIRVQEVKEAK